MDYLTFDGRLGEVFPESENSGKIKFTYFVWKSNDKKCEGVFILKDVECVSCNTEAGTFIVTLRDGTDILCRDKNRESEDSYGYKEFKDIFLKQKNIEYLEGKIQLNHNCMK